VRAALAPRDLLLAAQVVVRTIARPAGGHV
jgi:hypothetical protein